MATSEADVDLNNLLHKNIKPAREKCYPEPSLVTVEKADIEEESEVLTRQANEKSIKQDEMLEEEMV